MSPRRTLIIRTMVPSAFAAVALSSCGFVPEADLVASVEGTELSEGEFDALVREFVGDDEIINVEGDTARQIVGTFVGLEILRADLEAMGVEPVATDTEAEGVAALQADFQTMVQTWSSLPAATTVDDLVVEHYEAGAEASGIVCAAHILVATEEDADAVAAQLADGADFAETAASVSSDSGSAANGGSLGCLPTEQFELQFIPEFVDAALGAEIGVPTAPVESEFGWHIIQLLPADQLGDQDAIVVRLATFEDRYEIVIDPRFGQWDPNAIITPVI